MHYLVKILLSIYLCCLFMVAGAAESTHNFGSFTQNQSYTNSVDASLLEQEVSARMDRVAEFKFIREVAEKYNVDIYLFGGTASAYAHYVRWDLLRETGDPRFQPERFDYFFDNIYRSNQDLDIVVDSDAETAKKIASELKKKFNHFVGNKEAWEVRLLREKTGDKLPLIDDPDFANQHTDSNSIGVIKVNDSSDRSFYDLRDWDNSKSLYLNDVASASMTYLFSGKHKSTSRYKDGKNPPILSAIRYLAKATQYELTLKEDDLKKIIEVVASTNINNLSSYSKKKLSEFALKALLNSPDVEYAWDLLEKTGARKLAIQSNGSQGVEDSISWWLSKEPLRSKAVGKGRALKGYTKKGQSAKELGIDIVAHETNSFQAFDNITRSTQGRPNVFISRSKVNGEAAVYGDGFYTKIGLEGARGTGITIRFKVHPDAREGVDFIKEGSYIIFKNKNAIELIPEKVSIAAVDYFELLTTGQIGENDKGLINRIRNRINKTGVPSLKDIKKIKSQIIEDIKHSDTTFAVEEWFSFEFSKMYPGLLESIISEGYNDAFIAENVLSQRHWARHKNAVKYLKMLINNGDALDEILEFVLSKEYWAKRKVGATLLKSIMDNSDITHYVVSEFIFSEEHWRFHKSAPGLIKKVLKSRNVYGEDLAPEFFDRDELMENPNKDEIVKVFVESGEGGDSLIDILASSYWAKHPYGAKHIYKLISQKDRDTHNGLLSKVLSMSAWKKHPEYIKLLKKIISEDLINAVHLENLMAEKHWARHPDGASLLKLIINSESADLDYILEETLTKKEWFKNPAAAPLLSLVIGKKDYYDEVIVLEILSKKYWAEHINGAGLLNKLFLSGGLDSDIAALVLSQEHWAKHSRSFEFLKKIFKAGSSDREIVEYILSKKYWAKDSRSDRILEEVIKYGDADYEVKEYVLSQDYWKGHENYDYFKLLLETPQNKRMNMRKNSKKTQACKSALG